MQKRELKHAERKIDREGKKLEREQAKLKREIAAMAKKGHHVRKGRECRRRLRRW